MKQYDVYGVGNALLDMVYKLSDETLAQFDAPKGMMTLIEEQMHHQLITGLSDKKATMACGGSAANTIITAQSLGAKTFYSCSVANDITGNLYYHDLITHGVDTNLTQTNRPEGHTGKCIAMITPDADRTMCTYLGITTELHKKVLNERAIAASRYVYIEGYLVTSDTSRQAAISAREAAEKLGTKTSITLSDPFIVKSFKSGLLEMIGNQVDLLFCNEQEALMLCDTDDLEEAQENLKKYAKQYVITRGKEGATGFDGNMRYTIPACETQLLDTLGAGDTFSGAFLYAITHGYPFEDSLHFANEAAARVVEKLGPRLNTQELRQVKENMEVDLVL
jgi:sugar/nucleoside kinase (ribokinase family)